MPRKIPARTYGEREEQHKKREKQILKVLQSAGYSGVTLHHVKGYVAMRATQRKRFQSDRYLYEAMGGKNPRIQGNRERRLIEGLRMEAFHDVTEKYLIFKRKFKIGSREYDEELIRDFVLTIRGRLNKEVTDATRSLVRLRYIQQILKYFIKRSGLRKEEFEKEAYEYLEKIFKSREKYAKAFITQINTEWQ